MEIVASSSSELVAANNPEDISTPENKETSPLSSEAKPTNKKRPLEEDLPTEQSSGEAITGASMGSSVTSSPQSQASLLPQKKRRLDDEPSVLNLSGQVGDGVDDDTGDSLTTSIAAAAPATATTIPSISTPAPTLMTPPTPHSTLVQISAAAALTESSPEDTWLDTILTSLPFTETQTEEKDANIRPLKKARLDMEPTATNRIPTSSTTLGSTEPLAVVISNANPTLQMNALSKPPPFVVLPVELFSEILIYTGSPQHVLAVARTCKALCQTLLSTNNQFIWREARRACAFNLAAGPVYLPDPPKEFFGEAAYAAFVFDSGVCEACGKETNMMYASFALRARLCKNLQCHNSFAPTLHFFPVPGSDLLVARVVPVVESNACLIKVSHEHQLTFYTTNLVASHCRKSVWLHATGWIMNARRDDTFHKKYEKVQARNVRWMEFTVSLHKWKFARQTHYYSNRNFNESLSRNFASKFGWDHTDMMNSTVYGLYHRQKIKIMEKVKETDVRVMIDRIDSELLALSEKRARHAAEVAYLKNRGDIERHYHSIRSSKSAPPTEDTTITQTLASNSLMRSLLSDQLKQWVEAAKGDFAVLLGFPKKWKNASKNVLHPVERATARFQCIRCGTKEKDRGKRTSDGCLNFAAACQHVCSTGGRAMKGKRGRWDASNFVTDDKAIHALRKIIQALNYNEEKAGALAMIAFGLAVLCSSCDSPMILDSRGVVGHCHRHETMELTLTLSDDTITSYLGGYPFTFGLTEKLMGSEGLTMKGKKAIESKNYGCRHCLRVKQVELAAAASEKESSEEAGERIPEPLEAVQVKLSTMACRMHDLGIEGPKERPPPLFNFNGMRSHLKAKHHIEMIRDEDFLCYDDIDL